MDWQPRPMFTAIQACRRFVSFETRLKKKRSVFVNIRDFVSVFISICQYSSISVSIRYCVRTYLLYGNATVRLDCLVIGRVPSDWHDMAWHGLICHGMAQHIIACDAMACHSMPWPRPRPLPNVRCRVTVLGQGKKRETAIYKIRYAYIDAYIHTILHTTHVRVYLCIHVYICIYIYM